MAVIDVTRDWLRALDNYVVIGTPLAQDTVATRRYDAQQRKEDAPERPTRQEWNPDGTGNAGMLGNFRRLFHTLQLFGAGEPDTLYGRSLFPRPGAAGLERYALTAGDREARGHLYLLEAAPPAAPFTANLRRFVAYVPAHYSRNGDAGHYAWLHFPPVFDAPRRRAPRAAAEARYYPDSIWTHKYIADYLYGHKLLASFSASRINAVLLLPVHRLTAGNALEPLSDVRHMMPIVQALFRALEALDPRLRARGQRQAGTLAGVGVSCFSFGAYHCARLFRRPAAGAAADYEKLRAGAFLDGVTGEAREACGWMVNPGAGWLRTPLPGSGDVPKRLILFQQPNSGGSDFVGPFSRVNHAAPLGPGDTLDVLAVPPSWRNAAKFHRVHMRDMMCAAGEPNCRNPRHGYYDWHGLIHALFAETALGFCRDCFLW